MVVLVGVKYYVIPDSAFEIIDHDAWCFHRYSIVSTTIHKAVKAMLLQKRRGVGNILDAGMMSNLQG